MDDEPWGLGSISSRTQMETTDIDHQTYVYDDSAGAGTFAYMLDTGIRITHEGFEGRAIRGYNGKQSSYLLFSPLWLASVLKVTERAYSGAKNSRVIPTPR